MADYFKIETGALQNDAATVSDYIKTMRQEIKKMKNSKQALDKMWDGPASETFKAAFDGDIDLVLSLMDVLDEIYKFENMARKEYDKCEDRVNQLVRSIRV